MATKKTSDLSLAGMKKKDSQTYKEKDRVEFPEGKVDIELNFRPTKKMVLIAELIDVLKQAVFDNKQIDANNSLAVEIALIMKHFTSLNISGLEANNFDGLVTLFSLLSDNGYLEPIMKAFDPVELEKLFNEIKESLIQYKKDVEKITAEMKSENKAVDIDA